MKIPNKILIFLEKKLPNKNYTFRYIVVYCCYDTFLFNIKKRNLCISKLFKCNYAKILLN